MTKAVRPFAEFVENHASVGIVLMLRFKIAWDPVMQAVLIWETARALIYPPYTAAVAMQEEQTDDAALRHDLRHAGCERMVI